MNYRVVRFPDRTTATGEYLAVQEVYYDEQGKPIGYCDATVGGDDRSAMALAAALMIEAFDKEVLDVSVFLGVSDGPSKDSKPEEAGSIPATRTND